MATRLVALIDGSPPEYAREGMLALLQKQTTMCRMTPS